MGAILFVLTDSVNNFAHPLTKRKISFIFLLLLLLPDFIAVSSSLISNTVSCFVGFFSLEGRIFFSSFYCLLVIYRTNFNHKFWFGILFFLEDKMISNETRDFFDKKMSKMMADLLHNRFIALLVICEIRYKCVSVCN